MQVLLLELKDELTSGNLEGEASVEWKSTECFAKVLEKEG